MCELFGLNSNRSVPLGQLLCKGVREGPRVPRAQ